MRGLTIKVLLFLSPVLIIILVLELALRSMPNDYKVKGKYLEEFAGEIEVLILGSSHAYYGIDPEYFSSSCFNASFYSQTLRYDLEILKHYQSEFKSLKAIVLPVSYFSLYSQLETGNAPYLVKKYNLYMGMDVSSALKDHMELLGIRLQKNIKKLSDYYLKGEDPITCTDLGWGTTHHSRDRLVLEKAGASASLRHTRLIEEAGPEQKTENLAYLRELIGICKDGNINLLLFIPPAHKAYSGPLKKEYLDNNREIISQMLSEFENGIYLDLLNDPDFIEEDYYDADHMNEIGARKLSEKLDAYLSFFNKDPS